MNSVELIESFSDFKELKSIDRVTMMRVLEDVFRSMIKKKYGTDDNFDIIINAEKGDLQIWWNREVVDDEEVEDKVQQIPLSEAIQEDADFEVGEEHTREVEIESFGRRAIMSMRQNLLNRVLEIEKEDLINKYKDREKEIVTGEVYQIWKREMMIVDDEGNELILPKSEQIPSDFFKKGDTVRAVIQRVDLKNNNPVIVLSRTAPEFLERLFELEVPEIADGLITIRKVVREPGERAKIAVESYDDRIDPVGACVGMKGSRIHGIVRELRNENIDVINYTTNTSLFISRSLSPAKITNITTDPENHHAYVYLKPDQVSMAIGKGGLNIKLAGQLTEYEIDVFRDSEEDEYDIELEEFSDEIESWIIDEFKKIGCDTAKSVLELKPEELVRRTELEEETVHEVMSILRSEFD